MDNPEYSLSLFMKLAKDRIDDVDPMIIDSLVPFDDFMLFKTEMAKEHAKFIISEGSEQEKVEFLKEEGNKELMEECQKDPGLSFNITSISK